MGADLNAEGASGPLCADCKRPLRETLRVETLDAVADGAARAAQVAVSFCGACGTAISAIPQPRAPEPPRVPDPENPEDLEGRFQLRCRELIEEIQRVGFMPGGWIGLITRAGAAGAARELLSSGRILPVTPWLLQRGREDLTMEREITRGQWAEIFSHAERAEAEERLQRAGREQ